MQEINPKISFYKNAKDNIGTFTTVDEALDFIYSGEYPCPYFKLPLSGAIAKLRSLSKGEYDKQKKQLPAVTWSGFFIKRAKDHLHKHSCIICIDLDKLAPEALTALRARLMHDPYVFAMFTSPSGTGLKILFLIDMAIDANGTTAIDSLHEQYFRAIANYLKGKYAIKDKELDESGKDTARLCFLSHDPKIYDNDNARQIDFVLMHEWLNLKTDIVQQETPTLPAAKQKHTTPDEETEQPEVQQQPATGTTNFEPLRKIQKFTEKILVYEPERRNKFINQFVVNCKEQGIEQQPCEDYCSIEFSDYKDGITGIKAIIKSVYSNGKIIFGKRAQKNPPSETRQPQSLPAGGHGTQTSLISQGLTKYNDTLKFWYWTEKTDKNGDPVGDPKTGEVKKTLCFDHDKITFFLNNNGFKQIKIGDGYQFVRIKDNKLEPVRDQDMTAFVLEYLSQNLKTDEAGNYTEVEDEFYEVRRMFKRGKKTYCSETALQSLPIVKPSMVRDTEDTAFVYFRNCFVEVTASGITTKQYSQLKGHIWAKQVIDKDFTTLDFTKDENNSVFQNFLELAVVGDVKEWAEREEQKFGAAATGIGYLCHGYKDPTNARAVITADGKPRHANESNGGSGKSLYFKAVGKMVNTCLINGKVFKFDQQYPFGTLLVDHKLAVFNDVKKNFSFEDLFHYITEDWDLKRLYADPIVIPFEDSAKVGVATNFSVQGNSDSFLRRQHVIEFSNYFNAQRDPIKVFKKRFFTHWDDAEWNRFYNFMILCIRKFLKTGLIPYPLENYGINKLRDGMGEEGADWLDDNFADNENAMFRIGIRYDKAEILKKLKNDLPQYDKVKPNTFTGWVKEWCRIKGYDINAHKPADGIDKSGSTYYWTFTKPVAQNG